MAYEYYCSYCGKKLTQATVLYDVQHLLIEEESETFNVLKLRLTETELKSLMTGSVDSDGYHECTLTLEQVMGYVGNKNNLRDPMVAGLTMEMIDKYTEEPLLAAAPVTASSSAGDWDDDDEDDEEDVAAAAEPEEEPEEEPLPLPLQALEDKVHAMVGDKEVSDILKSDLEILKTLFQKTGKYTFLIRENTEDYDGNQKLLVGYQIRYPVSGRNKMYSCRICPQPKCGKEVFEHAGAAEHRSVVFIGKPGSGKTSCILALTHYARNHMVHDLGTTTWKGAEQVTTIRDLELIGASPELQEHLRLYGQGIAPERTEADAREKAYSATFWVTSETGKNHILTLTDLPGEICENKENKVDVEKVINEFQVALGCDAFILCFDTTHVTNSADDEIADVVDRVCILANTFQKLRIDHNPNSHQIPMMLLFTKCSELEGENPVMPVERTRQPMERVYMFRGEKEIIDSNGVYHAVCDRFNTKQELKKAYHAMLRCSPFGDFAPTQKDVKEKGKEPVQLKPRNIDRLMRWLMMVSGSAPVEGRYCPTLHDDGSGLRTTGFYLTETQYRAKGPKDGWDSMEALSRMSLFENPGKLDRVIVEDYGQSKWVIRAHQFQYRNAQNDD